MASPNLFLIYVSDVKRSTNFYRELFEIEPTFVSPRYVAFEVAPQVLFAIWNGHQENLTSSTRTSEVGLMVPGPASAVDDMYKTWVSKGARVIAEPHDDVFGRTFLVSDPDGNLIRVSPID